MVRVAISQPEHFPYLGYFAKMRQSDVFVLLDDVRFSGPRSFQNRNRLRSSSGGEEWLTVPVVSGSHSELLIRVRTSEDPNWRRRVQRKLTYHFGADFSYIYEPQLLCEINIRSILLLRHALGIAVPLVRSSSLGCEGEKAVRIMRICERLGGTTYVCGSGGAAYLQDSHLGKVSIEFFREDVPDYFSTLVHLTPDQIARGLSLAESNRPEFLYAT